MADWAPYGIGEPEAYGEDGTPIYAEYRVPEDVKPTPPTPSGASTWWVLLSNWEYVEADLQQYYQVSTLTHAQHPWPWMHTLICRLADIPESRVSRLTT